MAATKLPAFALFPLASWREQLPPNEWVACLDAWLALVDSHLSLSQNEFTNISTKDESLATFLASFVRETALGGAGILGSSQSAKRLLKDVFLLASQLLQSTSPPSGLAEWEFLADLSRVYGKKKTEALVSHLTGPAQAQLDTSLASLKKFLIKNLDAGIQGGDLRAIEEQLDRVGDLIHSSPSVAGFFLAGDDFLDGLISCFKVMNPPLRKVIISTTYLCLIGLAEGQKMSALTDQLYSLKTAGATHKAGPLNINDSLVAELVTSTPVLQQLQRKLEDSGNTSSRTKSILTELGTFRKLGAGMPRPKRFIKRKIDKGKGLASHEDAQIQQEIHIHLMSQISQIQDLFPDLGSGFIAKLLDEYADNTEQVISHLLEDSLPPHLHSASRTEQLSPSNPPPPSFTPHPTPPLAPTTATLPTRHNIFDNDDLDLLQVDTSRLQLGKRNLNADDLLADRAAAPNKAAILSALAAFDSDDDERDDTYDAADVGGTVDAAGGEDDQPLAEGIEEALFRTWTATPKVFERDNSVRKGVDRAKLRDVTGMADEQIEGWAVMLGRDAQLRKRLQVRYGEWTGAQNAIESTAWRSGLVDEDGEEEGSDGVGSGPGGRGGAPRGRAGRGRGGRGGPGGGGGGRGGAAPTPAETEQARRRKEANKGSRANHNRRDQRARKMARGGLPG